MIEKRARIVSKSMMLMGPRFLSQDNEIRMECGNLVHEGIAPLPTMKNQIIGATY